MRFGKVDIKGVTDSMDAIHNFVDTLTSMMWSDYLDIIVVAFLIYKILPLIRTPSTMRIARAVAALVVIAWLTNEAHLYTVSFILNQFLAVGILAFVVLFQPELRRMLDHLGNVRLSDFFTSDKPVAEMELVISQTVMACEVMSRERVGALIVFAREQRLEEYFKTGTQIDGQVSEQLIRNIFFPKASLHDGAMILRDGKIHAAACGGWMNAMTIRHCAAIKMTSWSGVKTLMIGAANTYNTTPMIVIMIMAIHMVVRKNRLARSGLPAPSA